MRANRTDEAKATLKQSFRDRSAAVGVPLMIRALSCTMLRVNHFYGACVGRMLWWTNNETKRIARRNLEIAFPDLPEKEREHLLRKNLMELGKTITELGKVWTWGRKRVQRSISDINGEQHLTNGFDQGNGVIVLVPHSGSWELMGLYLSIEHGITSLYRPPRLRSVERFTRRVRERFGAKLVPTDVTGVRELRRALAQNRLIGILPDQDPGESGGTLAPFFGYSARTMLLASKLAAKSGAPVIYGVAERLEKGRGYRLHFVPADPEIASKDDSVAATAVNKGVEDVIRINPAQYQWSYKRYKSSAEGDTNVYDMPERRAA